jgi:Flp pilus assembly protein TadB
VSLVVHHASDGTIQLSIQSWVVTYNVLNIIDIATTVLLIVAFYLTFIWAWQNKQKKKGENMLEKIPDAEAS